MKCNVRNVVQNIIVFIVRTVSSLDPRINQQRVAEKTFA